MKQISRYFLISLCAVCLAPALMLGQTSAAGYGTVTGRITDPSGAAVPGAKVTIVDRSTNISRTSETNGTGLYVFPDVKPSTYDVSVTKSGFEKAILSGQTVTVGLALNLNVTLRVGTTTQTVQITATPGAELQTLNSTIGTSLSGNTLLQLPTFARDATSLLYYQPTAVPSVAMATGDISSGTVAGQTADQNTYSIDGGNATDTLSGDNGYINGFNVGVAAIPTPIESFQEFNVTDTNATASFSNSSGGHVMLVTKRGTDAFHGSAYDYLQNSALDTNDWGNNFSHSPKPVSTYNRFGGDFGGPLLPRFAGGKTYFYFFYEGFRWPQTTIFNSRVPSALMRQGILQFADNKGNVIPYNLANSTQCGPTGGQLCDPMGLGLNPLISQVWSKYEPLPNNTLTGDLLNTFGYQAPLAIPESTNYLTGRVDHDFGSRLRWFASYRWYNNTEPTTQQVDIGGLLPGDKFGAPAAISRDANAPRYFVTGLTATLAPNITNDFHFSYMRNYWGWNRGGFLPSAPGVTVPLEIGGEVVQPLGPIDLRTQDARQRLWNGHDWDYRDSLNWLKGNHFLTLGGEFMHDWQHFNRYDDVVAGLANTVIDQVSNGGGQIFMPTSNQPVPCVTATQANCLPSGSLASGENSWNELYADTLGIVDQSQTLVSRHGNNLSLNPLGSPLQSYMLTNFYNLYATDSWKIKPSFTFTLGLSWGYTTPPHDINGAQDILVGAGGGILTVPTYLNGRLTAAEAGQPYAPTIGYSPLGDVNGGLKYPYQPFYGGFQPRVAFAWNPNVASGWLHKLMGDQATVIRGGYGRIYYQTLAIAGVSNTVLGDGFLQPIGCTDPSPAGGCAGFGNLDPSSAFRIGLNGPAAPLPPIPSTLSIPVIPGNKSVLPSANAAYISALSAGDNYNLPPGYSDQVNLTIQRQFPGNLLVEVGYVANWDHDLYQGIDLDDVPWMMKQGGQTFANAYDNLWKEINKSQPITAQPFFETALGGARSGYCNAFASCSAAVASNEFGNITTESVTNLWSDLDSSFVFGPQLLSTTQCHWCYYQTDFGFANYNGLIATVQKRTGRGLMLSGNFTYSHALGTFGLEQTYTLANMTDPWNPRVDYGPQYFDRKFISSIVATYNLPIGPGQRFLPTNNPVLKRILGGWTIAPIFVYTSGQPLDVYTGSSQEFGQGLDGNGVGAQPMINTASLSNSAHQGVNPTGAIGFSSAAKNGGPGVNMFSNPVAVYNGFLPCLVGICDRSSGAGQLRGPSLWNLDFSINKTTKITERVSLEFFSEWFNGLNHMAWGGSADSGFSYSLQNPNGFGTLSQFNALQSNYTRIIQLGMRLSF